MVRALCGCRQQCVGRTGGRVFAVLLFTHVRLSVRLCVCVCVCVSVSVAVAVAVAVDCALRLRTFAPKLLT